MPQRRRKVEAATVSLWGKQVGAIAWDATRQYASFEYAPSFLRDGFEISPFTMPRRAGIFSFPTLNRETYHGLPGLLADSLPDRFGNALIDFWLSQEGRTKDDFSPVERLCYVGMRGMGALEFKPAIRGRSTQSVPIEIAKLTELAQKVIDARAGIQVNFDDPGNAMNTIIRVGTSAGGARAKALIAWNPETNEVRSGDVPPPPGFQSWILKFDGVHDNTLDAPKGYGRIEYAYHRMAMDAGIQMSACTLLKEGGRAHFMTRRFDRTEGGDKIHMHSLCGMQHYDFNSPGQYAYEQAFATIQKLNLGYAALTEMFRRMVFNIVARNQDDHTRNIAFLMESTGEWKLSPAFDVMWAYNERGSWTNRHQMSVNGKRDGFRREDLLDPARRFGIKNAESILDQTRDVVKRWPEYAAQEGIPEPEAKAVAATHRISL
jgi:serine/threonine-protein kinase HipA